MDVPRSLSSTKFAILEKYLRMRVDEKGAGSEGVEEAVESIHQQWRDRLERRIRRRRRRILHCTRFRKMRTEFRITGPSMRTADHHSPLWTVVSHGLNVKLKKLPFGITTVAEHTIWHETIAEFTEW